MSWILLFACIIACRLTLVTSKSYEGHRLLRFTPSDARQVQLLANLTPSTEDAGISFWSEPRAVGQPVDLLVSPAKYPEVVRFAEHNQMKLPQVLVEDIER